MSLAKYLNLGGKNLDNMEDLLVEELKDLYDVEKRLTKALSQMEDAAHDPQLKTAFRSHRAQTEHQKQRLEKCFSYLNMKPDGETCEGIKGILEEGDAVINADGQGRIKDAALIAAAQRVEHYEMAGYGTARTLAQHLQQQDIASLLQETLNEEGETDHKLTELATSYINPPS